MCFNEYVGYRCGHCSVPVLRPCPMTTQQHSSPVCAVRADLPVVVDWFCPNCERIMHSRRVLIQEWEHRFLHERGACPCDVVFPFLLRPRMIGLEEGADEQHLLDTSAGGRAGAVPPAFIEQVGPDGRPSFAVRLTSLFGAEWREDHAQLHETGQCQCGPADFATYRGDNRFSDFPAPMSSSLVAQCDRSSQTPVWGGVPSENVQTQMYQDSTGREYYVAGSIVDENDNIQPGRVPLVGFPIGAGPEGCPHAGPFEDCALRCLTDHEAPAAPAEEQDAPQ